MAIEEAFINRVLAKLDKIEDRLNDLCNRTTRQEVKFEESINNSMRSQEIKFRVLTLLVAVFGSSFAMLNILRFVGIL